MEKGLVPAPSGVKLLRATAATGDVEKRKATTSTRARTARGIAHPARASGVSTFKATRLPSGHVERGVDRPHRAMTQHFPLTPGRRESGERPAGLPITTSAREHSRGTAGWMSAPEAANPWGQVHEGVREPSIEEDAALRMTSEHVARW